MSRELPPGWRVVKLGEVGQVKGGKRLPKGSEYAESKTEHPYIRVSDFKDGGIDQSNLRYLDIEVQRSISRYTISKDDVYISIAGTIGLTGTIPPELDGANLTENAAKISFDKTILDKQFIIKALRSEGLQRRMQEETIATAVSKLALFRIEGLEIPIPPLDEQRRIVARIEELTARSKTAKEALQAIPPLLEKFRQSVLAAAFRGDLTAEWRHLNPQLEPAEVLLERNLSEYQAKTRKIWSKNHADGKPELPPGWSWCSVGQLCLGNIQTGPFGAQLHNTDFQKSGVPIIAIGNVRWGHLDLTDVDCVSEDKAEQLTRFRVETDDVLFTRSGTVGRSAIVPQRASGFVMSSHILRVRQDPRFYLPELMFRAFRGEPTIKNQLLELTRGATRPGFNTQLLSGMTIPVPPLAEQSQILERLQALDVLIESFAEKTKLIARLDGLDRSILAKAFRGELAPQEPTDEPATAHLERLRTQSPPSKAKTR